jgi:hypothetical protein
MLSQGIFKMAQNFLNFPYLIQSIDLLPAGFCTIAKSYPGTSDAHATIWVVPEQDICRSRGRTRVPSQALIFTQSGVLHIEAPESKGQDTQVRWISVQHMVMLKLSLILLYGKLEIWGLEKGTATKIEVEYNTVSHHLIEPALKRLVQNTWNGNPPAETDFQPDLSFGSFVHTSFSFYNGLCNHALQAGESVLNYVFQPEIRRPVLKIFRKKVAPQSVMVLTTQQLILLQEDLRQSTHHEWIFTFVPLHRVCGLEEQTYKTWQKWVVRLLPAAGAPEIELILDPDNGPGLSAVQNRLHQIGLPNVEAALN